MRSMAAFVVFFHHANSMGLDGGGLAYFRRDIGHGAVVVFFVLSGYVIAATVKPKQTILDYTINRASRVLSVAIPALLLTFIVGVIGQWLNIGIEPDYQLNKPLLYFVIASAFVGNVWTLGLSTFSNVPWWSLEYEVWYYAIFAVAIFTRRYWALFGTALLLVAAGPKIVLLFPVWLSGVGIYWVQQHKVLSRVPARLLCVAASLTIGVMKFQQWDKPLDVLGPTLITFPLQFSQWFLSDYLLGALTMLIVYTLATTEWKFPRLVERIVRWSAGISFSLYLIHYPLLILLGHLLPHQGWLATGGTLAISIAFGTLFEPQKSRLRRWMRACHLAFCKSSLFA